MSIHTYTHRQLANAKTTKEANLSLLLCLYSVNYKIIRIKKNVFFNLSITLVSERIRERAGEYVNPF